MSKRHTGIRVNQGAPHFLEQLEVEAERAEAKLTAAARKLAAMEALHRRMTAKVERDAPPSDLKEDQLSRLAHQRDRVARELNLAVLCSAHHKALWRHRSVLEAVMIGNCFALERVARSHLKQALLPRGHHLNADEKAALDGLARALHDYLWIYPSDEADSRIRESWQRLEPSMEAGGATPS